MANGNPRILLRMEKIGFLRMVTLLFSGFWKEMF
jgi:hypothetical protein